MSFASVVCWPNYPHLGRVKWGQMRTFQSSSIYYWLTGQCLFSSNMCRPRWTKEVSLLFFGGQMLQIVLCRSGCELSSHLCQLGLFWTNLECAQFQKQGNFQPTISWVFKKPYNSTSCNWKKQYLWAMCGQSHDIEIRSHDWLAFPWKWLSQKHVIFLQKRFLALSLNVCLAEQEVDQ